MKNGLLQQAARFYQNWRRKQLWYRMVSGMACVVVFCTVYALILPAITLEKEPGCGLEEHTHTEACYTVETVWPSTEYLCSEESLSGHVHGEDCYDEDGNLICGYADFVVHTHDESCYDRNGDLACPLEEIEEHRHDADCYSSTEVLTCGEEETGHVHDKSCYTRVRGDMTCGLEEEEGHTHGSGCYETERDLVCTLEEGEDHTHDESCYETRQVLTCELEENEGHTHGDSCYDWTEELTCGREEAEGHIHDGSCYTTVRELVCDEEEVTLHTHDEDCFDEDGNLICGKVQVLAHQHDETCAVEPEGEPEEMQVLTCGLKEHTHTDACWDQNAEEELAYLCGMEEHAHIEDCYNKDGELTCDLPEHVHSETCVTPLEPEEALPDNAFPEELPEGYTEYSYDSEDGLSVLVYAPENAFGGQAVTLKADKLAEDSQGYMDAQANLDAAEDVEYDGFVALDIRFEDEAGTEVEPDAAQGPVYVKLDALALLPESANRASVAVQHHCTEATDPIVAVSAEPEPEPEMDPETETETEPEPEPETVVRTVADCNADTGTVEVTPTAQTLEADDEQEEAALDVTAAFAVEEFSTFTVTWADGAYTMEIEPVYYKQPIHSGIELRLFDYGTYINSSGRPLGFWAGGNGPFGQIDGNGSTLNGSPTMSRSLGADGYPEVVYKSEPYSLKYLFRDDGDPLVLGGAAVAPNVTPLDDYSNMRTNATAQNGYKTYYESMRLEVDGDGGLFHVDEDGYYTYASSEQSAYFDQDKGRFLVNDTLIKPGHFTSTANLIENGNFLPFDRIDEKADKDRFTRVDGTGKAVYRTGYAGTKDLRDSVADLWFGMTMGIDFNVPADGKVNGKDMVFEFKGDDDVWVYIDDVLVLDIGGTHGAQSGTINFATGAVNSPRLNNTNLKAVFKAAGRNTEEGFKGNTFVDWSEHTLKFYYMERGGNISYCSLKFNLQIRPEKSLQVTKNLTANSDADADVADADVVEHLKNTAEYKFRVVKADSEGNPTDQLLIKKGDTYTISGSGLPSDTTRTVGEGGYFTLKAGQVATFSDMLARFGNGDAKQYVVQEVLPSGLVEQYGDIAYTVDSDTNTCTNDTTTVEENFTGFSSPAQAADKGTIVAFNNKVDTQKLSRLKITKEQVGSSFDDSQTYYMQVLLGPDEDHLSPVSSGTTYGITHANGDKVTKTVAAPGILVLNAGDTAELKLLAGTCYQVKEVASGTGTPLTGKEGYTPTYENDTGKVEKVGSTVQVTVTNTFPNGALELTKTVRNTAGGDTSGEFEFELKCPVKEGWEGASCPVTYTSSGSGQTHTGGTLSFTPQDGYAVATVKLYHDETVTVSELPTGAQVTATELNADGYSVGWNADGSETYAKAVTVTIPDGSVASVTCTNTTGMEFPETGGAGTGLYTMGGLLLIAGAGILLLRERAKRRREDGITA